MKKYQPLEILLRIYGEDIIRTSNVGDFSGGQTGFGDGNSGGSGNVDLPPMDF